MAINNGYKQVVSFTTRKPRNDEELDTYVFLTRKQFARKMFNGDFMETEVFN
jgi:guanylate kinase